MKLIKPFYKILTPINGDEILKSIEKAARTCYKSEDKIQDGSAEKLAQMLLNRGHEAMIEFGPSITVKFICDRGVSHEFVRHRLASFAQESTRYCNYGKDEHITFIIPCWLGITEGNYEYDDIKKYVHTNQEIWLQAIYEAEINYYKLVRLKNWKPQQARSVLPNSLKTELNIKANIREWRHIFKMRTAKTAHPQMQELMQPLLDEFKEKIPILFDDIIY